MRFIRILIIVSYLLRGMLAMFSLADLLLRNVWLNLFEIEKITPNWIEYEKKEVDEIIRYNFQVEGKNYSGERHVVRGLIEERLPKNKDEIKISYNSLFPKVNFIEELRLQMKNGFLGLTISGFFLLLTLAFDVFGNTRKWESRYEKALK